MSRNDGGPAFPEFQEHTVYRDGMSVPQWWPEGGMSLRDWFAGQALRHIDLDMADRVAAPEMPTWDEVSEEPDTYDEYVVPRAEIARRIATVAYFLADAMLKVRDAR